MCYAGKTKFVCCSCCAKVAPTTWCGSSHTRQKSLLCRPKATSGSVEHMGRWIGIAGRSCREQGAPLHIGVGVGIDTKLPLPVLAVAPLSQTRMVPLTLRAAVATILLGRVSRAFVGSPASVRVTTAAVRQAPPICRMAARWADCCV